MRLVVDLLKRVLFCVGKSQRYIEGASSLPRCTVAPIFERGIALELEMYLRETQDLIEKDRVTCPFCGFCEGDETEPPEEMASIDWEEDCQHYRGRLLTGVGKHWCPDWDGLPMDSTCVEWVLQKRNREQDRRLD